MSLEQDIRTVEIEMNLTGAVRDYAMYTELGNAGVHAIVETARANDLSWSQVYGALRRLADSNEDVFGEATDTAVRECVYDALGFDRKGQNFYA
jgi:hypothetical protein